MIKQEHPGFELTINIRDGTESETLVITPMVIIVDRSCHMKIKMFLPLIDWISVVVGDTATTTLRIPGTRDQRGKKEISHRDYFCFR